MYRFLVGPLTLQLSPLITHFFKFGSSTIINATPHYSGDAWKALDEADVESSDDNYEQDEEEDGIDFLAPGGADQTELGTRFSQAGLSTGDQAIQVKEEPLSELDANQG